MHTRDATGKMQPQTYILQTIGHKLPCRSQGRAPLFLHSFTRRVRSQREHSCTATGTCESTYWSTCHRLSIQMSAPFCALATALAQSL